MPETIQELDREYHAALIAFLESATEQNLEKGYGAARSPERGSISDLPDRPLAPPPPPRQDD